MPDRCAQCGYDRRGLAPGRTCPECGLPADVHNLDVHRYERQLLTRIDRYHKGAVRSAVLGALILAGVLLALFAIARTNQPTDFEHHFMFIARGRMVNHPLRVRVGQLGPLPACVGGARTGAGGH